MRFEIEQRFVVSSAEVLRALTSAEYLTAAFAQLPDLSAPTVLNHERSGNNVRNKLQFVFSGHLPSVVTAVIDAKKLTWIEDTTIDLATATASFIMTPVHYASLFKCSGTWAIVGHDLTSASRKIGGTMKVNSPIPFTSSKVENAIISGLRDRLAVEPPVLVAWVRANR